MRITAPAKINLRLDVLAKRPDGYHSVRMIMHSLQWGDVLHVEPADQTQITCTEPHVPLDESNLVHRAITLLAEATGNGGARVHIEKVIPMEAGLGGGSADAAAVLRALNELWALHWSDERLAAFSLPLGSDVPYCVRRGLALAEGRGEILTMLPPCPSIPLVLATPRVHWAGPKTATVYRGFQAVPGRQSSVDAMVAGLRQGDLRQVAVALSNDLEPVATRLHPVIAELKSAMLAAGALGAVMSGAGPTVVALAEPDQLAAVAAAARRYTQRVVCTATA